MKGCFKIFAYILAGIFVLLVIAAIVSPSKPTAQPAGPVVADGKPTVLQPIEQTRLATTQAKERFGLDADGNLLRGIAAK